MKKIFLCLIPVALAVMACDNKDPNYSQSGFQHGGSDYPYVYASIADVKSVLDGNSVKWEKGDTIVVHGNALDDRYSETAVYLMKDDTDIEQGRFTFQRMKTGKKLTAVKSAELNSDGGSDLSSQSVAEGLFPLCLRGEASADDRIVFEHTVPYAKLSMRAGESKPKTIFKAQIVAPAIAGEQADTISLNVYPNVQLSEDKDNYVYFRTLPVSADMVKCILYDTDGGFMEEELGAEDFEIGAVSELPLVSYVPKKIVTYYPGTELEPISVHEYVDGEQREVLWAPVYCGYSYEHPNGLLYQYGRAAGQPYYPSAKDAAICKEGPVADPADDIFYKKSSNAGDWYAGTSLSAWPMGESEAGYVEGKIGNPCPSGWRLPTIAEVEGLMKIGFTQSTVWSFSATGTDEQKEAVIVTTGYTLKDESGLFFASVGGRTAAGQAYYRGTGADSYARIWTSDIQAGTGAGLATCFSLRRSKSSTEADGFAQTVVAMNKACGYSVRCVKK